MLGRHQRLEHWLGELSHKTHGGRSSVQHQLPSSPSGAVSGFGKEGCVRSDFTQRPSRWNASGGDTNDEVLGGGAVVHGSLELGAEVQRQRSAFLLQFGQKRNFSEVDASTEVVGALRQALDDEILLMKDELEVLKDVRELDLKKMTLAACPLYLVSERMAGLCRMVIVRAAVASRRLEGRIRGHAPKGGSDPFASVKVDSLMAALCDTPARETSGAALRGAKGNGAMARVRLTADNDERQKDKGAGEKEAKKRQDETKRKKQRAGDAMRRASVRASSSPLPSVETNADEKQKASSSSLASERRAIMEAFKALEEKGGEAGKVKEEVFASIVKAFADEMKVPDAQMDSLLVSVPKAMNGFVLYAPFVEAFADWCAGGKRRSSNIGGETAIASQRHLSVASNFVETQDLRISFSLTLTQNERTKWGLPLPPGVASAVTSALGSASGDLSEVTRGAPSSQEDRGPIALAETIRSARTAEVRAERFRLICGRLSACLENRRRRWEAESRQNRQRAALLEDAVRKMKAAGGNFGSGSSASAALARSFLISRIDDWIEALDNAGTSSGPHGHAGKSGRGKGGYLGECGICGHLTKALAGSDGEGWGHGWSLSDELTFLSGEEGAGWGLSAWALEALCGGCEEGGGKYRDREEMVSCDCGRQVPKRQLDVHRLTGCAHRVCACRRAFRDLPALSAHKQTECALGQVRCECGALVRRADVVRHREEECVLSEVPCECGAWVMRAELEGHRKHSLPLSCDYTLELHVSSLRRTAGDASRASPEGIWLSIWQRGVRCRGTRVTCECGTQLKRGDRGRHWRMSCPVKRDLCEKCGELVARGTLEAHAASSCPQEVECECGARPKRAHLLAHKEEECPEAPVTCGCFAVVRRRDLGAHVREGCPMTDVTCECGQKVPRMDIRAHRLTECPVFEVECSCGRWMERAELLAHREESCPRAPIVCVCGKRLQRRHLEAHRETDCPLSLVFCDCGEAKERRQMAAHKERECTAAGVECPNGCGARMQRRDVDTHKSTVCPKENVTCACGQDMTREAHQQHRLAECPVEKIRCECGRELERRTAAEHRAKDCPAVKAVCECGEVMKKAALPAHQATECLIAHTVCACGVMIVRKDMEAHSETECPAAQVECVCGVRLFRRELAGHLESACGMREDPCSCGVVLPRRQMQSHKASECRLRLVPCACGEVVKHEDLEDHRNRECPFRTVPCDCGAEVASVAVGTHLTRLCPERVCACGAGFTGVKELQEHLTSGLCPLKALECSCSRLIPREGLAKHKKSECSERVVTCECGESVRMGNLNLHLRTACKSRVCVCGFVATDRSGLALHQGEGSCPLRRIPCECGQLVQRSKMDEHRESDCPLRVVRCDCGVQTLQKSLAVHRNTGAVRPLWHCSASGLSKDPQGERLCTPDNKTPCPLCKAKVVAKDMEEHQAMSCPKTKVTCECGQKVLRGEMDNHRRVFCALRPVPCDCGCDPIPHRDLQKHRVTGQLFHLRFPCATLEGGTAQDGRIKCHCGAALKRLELPDHLKKACPLTITKCDCGVEVPQKGLEMHQKKACPNRVCECLAFFEDKSRLEMHLVDGVCPLRPEVERAEMEKHKQTLCPLRAAECECGLKTVVQKLKQHQEKDCPLRVCVCRERFSMPSEKDEHLRSGACPAAKEKCTQCGTDVPSKEIKTHMQKVCPKRSVTCKACQQSLPFSALKHHEDSECPNRQVKCGCGESVQLSNMEAHLKKDCKDRVCECKKVFNDRAALDKHQRLEESKPEDRCKWRKLEIQPLEGPAEGGTEVQISSHPLIPETATTMDVFFGETRVSASRVGEGKEKDKAAVTSAATARKWKVKLPPSGAEAEKLVPVKLQVGGVYPRLFAELKYKAPRKARPGLAAPKTSMTKPLQAWKPKAEGPLPEVSGKNMPTLEQARALGKKGGFVIRLQNEWDSHGDGPHKRRWFIMDADDPDRLLRYYGNTKPTDADLGKPEGSYSYNELREATFKEERCSVKFENSKCRDSGRLLERIPNSMFRSILVVLHHPPGSK
uniref:TRAF-type domain-containing protein n=1 Tax=Chromera velia CCMP2878 TaxID=1169474 RepID=A0A0G4FM04_9ALVE|eukprot:Cvel_17631.t1-p1 / transcript=Cvel_17631.t1 / gene=Cvel_17631 / organism=Chromera_velia_CCMP2878 / gene_product=Zinc finger protein 624, putative / transcript_product=Zinc finger protein 624, putative / location=Cvel_scaffold1419:12064-35735(-) / protein_length=2030 / sequence_SO=supercontig / SO=protein_coding / is_pseudo=false